MLMKNGNVDADNVVSRCKVCKLLADAANIGIGKSESVKRGEHNCSSATAVVHCDNTHTLVVIDCGSRLCLRERKTSADIVLAVKLVACLE